MQRELGARAVLDGVNPIVIRGGALWVSGEKIAQERLRVEFVGTRVAVGVVAVHPIERVEGLGVLIVGITIDEGFHLVLIRCFVLGLVAQLVFRGPDVIAFVIGGFVHQRLRFVEGGARVVLHRTAHLQRLELSPIRHGGVGIEARGFLERAIGLEVPEIVEQAEALIEVGLRLRRIGRDLHAGVADALHQRRRGKIGVILAGHAAVVVHHRRLSAHVGRRKSACDKNESAEAKKSNVSRRSIARLTSH